MHKRETFVLAKSVFNSFPSEGDPISLTSESLRVFPPDFYLFLLQGRMTCFLVLNIESENEYEEAIRFLKIKKARELA